MTINCHVLAHATYIYLVIISVVSSTIIVGEHGTDHILCGNRTHPCGSLHYASTLINSNFTHDGTITIHGQNTTQIHNYIGNETFTSLYHPCLPQPFDGNHPVIHFNDSSISSMADWYPPICVEYDKNRINFTTNRINFTTRTRSFMFEARDTGLTIHNLLIDMAPYAAFDMPFGIIGVFSDPEGSNMEHDLEDSNLHCVNCAFSNIDHTNPDLVLLYSTRYITLENCTFSNIQSVTDFIFMNAGTISLSHVNFYDFQLNESLIHVDSTSEITYGTGQNTVDIDHCQFVNIASQIALIYDQSISSNVAVYDVAFQNIYGGSIYRAYYQSNAPVHIANVYISTPQIIVSTKETLHSLFDFYFADPLVMDNITVDYQYDVIAHCESNPNGGHGGSIGATASAPQITYLRAECANPITLFQNDGANTIINNMDLSINITEDDISRFKDTVRGDYDYVYMEYIYLRDSHYQKNALILNYGNLTINTITVHGLPPGYFMIMNKDELSVSQLNIIWDRYGDYDPNVLQSTVFIAQTGLWPSTTLVDSHLDGGGMLTQIYMFSGTLTMQNTIFERTGNALIAKSGQAITISNCTFTRIGRYWAHIERVVYRDSYEINPLNIKFIDKTVLIEQSTFHGYQDCMNSVFLQMSRSYELILRHNLFAVNGTNYYNVTEWYQGNDYYDPCMIYALLLIFNNYKVSVYGNTFSSNTISPQTPWLSLDSNGYDYYDAPDLPSIPSCVSGNKFSNFAFDFYLNNVTSCFRPDLYLCVDRDCSDGHFGKINSDLFNLTSHFNIDPIDGTEFFIVGNDPDYGHFVHAMDNIQINIIGNGTLSTNWTWNPSQNHTRLFILDSIFPHNLQIEYDTNCSIAQYDRLINMTQYVAHFKMLCKSLANIAVKASTIEYVNHLSATQIRFTSKSFTYFPGQLLMFNYSIIDKLNGDCDGFSSFVISLENSALSLSQNIGIEDGGVCDACNTGVILLGVALKHFFGNSTSPNHTDTDHAVSIQTSIANNNLILIEDIIELYVTSCPVGYGSDSNDIQCLICPDGYYNLSPNNTDDCKDCHDDRNDGVLCHSGSVLIRYNWWLGFCGEDGSMTTSTCPNSYCCQDEGSCVYNQTEPLCANNRDVSVPLCGACLEGYTEAINSSECMICDEQYWVWFLKPIAVAVLFTVYLVFSNPNVADPPPKEEYKTYDYCNLCRNARHNKEFMLLSRTLVLRVLMYYEQALGSVMWPSFSSPFMAQIYAITSLFSLETNLLNTDSEPRCLFEGLTSKDKILLSFFPWLLIFALLCLPFLYEVCREYFISRSDRYKCGNTNFRKAFVALSIICAGQILSILFKLLNCHRVGELEVHFYFGSEQCFASWTMAVSLVCLALVVFFFAALFYFGVFFFVDDREKANFALHNFFKYYTKECYYWEWLVLLRRTLISAYAIFYTWEWYPSILVSINLICLGLHHKYQPFEAKEANIAEYFALCGVIVVITIQTTTASVGSLVVLCLFVIVPIIAVICYTIYKMKLIVEPVSKNKQQSNTCQRDTKGMTDACAEATPFVSDGRADTVEITTRHCPTAVVNDDEIDSEPEFMYK
eukprot:2_1